MKISIPNIYGGFAGRGIMVGDAMFYSRPLHLAPFVRRGLECFGSCLLLDLVALRLCRYSIRLRAEETFVD